MTAHRCHRRTHDVLLSLGHAEQQHVSAADPASWSPPSFNDASETGEVMLVGLAAAREVTVAHGGAPSPAAAAEVAR